MSIRILTRVAFVLLLVPASGFAQEEYGSLPAEFETLLTGLRNSDAPKWVKDTIGSLGDSLKTVFEAPDCSKNHEVIRELSNLLIFVTNSVSWPCNEPIDTATHHAVFDLQAKAVEIRNVAQGVMAENTGIPVGSDWQLLVSSLNQETLSFGGQPVPRTCAVQVVPIGLPADPFTPVWAQRSNIQAEAYGVGKRRDIRLKAAGWPLGGEYTWSGKSGSGHLPTQPFEIESSGDDAVFHVKGGCCDYSVRVVYRVDGVECAHEIHFSTEYIDLPK